MGTIAQKLIYLNGTKQALKESINNLGGDITSETTFREYAQELDNIYDNLPKTTGEGTNLSLTTLKGKMNTQLKGDTQQTTYNGYNLLNLTLSLIKSSNTSGTWNNNVYTISGLTITINEDMSIKVNGTTTAQVTLIINGGTMPYATGTYYLSGAINGSNELYDVRIFNYDNKSGVAQCFTGTKQTNIVNNSQSFNMAVVIRNGVTCNNTMFYPMLSTTNTTNYEPYVGGTASPNPTYPQDIEVVTGTQEVKVENAQLIDFSTLGNSNTSSSFNNDILTVSTNSGTYANAYKDITNLYKNNAGKVLRFDFSSISYDVTPNVRIVGIRVTSGGTNSNITLVDNNKNISTHTIPNDVSNITQVTLTIYANNTNTAVTNTLTINKPILHFGSTQIAYQPYKEQVQTISLGDIELCKIGNYQDYLYKSNDKWYKKEQIGKQIFTGANSEYWNTSGTSTSGYNRFTSALLYNSILKPTATSQVADIMSNYFIKKSADNTYAKIEGISVGTNGNLYIYADSLKEYTKEQFKTWLSTHNMEVRYVLVTPQDIEITNTNLIQQLDNLEKLKSYNGVTNINCSGNLSAILGVSALKGE